MAEQKIEFRKLRDFGENINDSFLFIRQNLKPLLATFFAICGIFMITQAILNGFYQSQSFSIFDDLIKGGTSPAQSPAGIFTLGYFFTILSTFVTFIAMHVSLGAYIKFYVENNGARPGIEEVWKIFRSYFFKVLLCSVPIILLIVLGMLFCILPGIWLAVVWAPFSLVLMIEDRTFGDAFNRCFDLIKESFWSSLAIYLVTYIVYSFCTGIIGLIVGGAAGVLTYLSTNQIGTTAGIVSSFLNVFSFTFYVIYFVSLALNYFNLVERRDATGILNRIHSIGSAGNTHNNQEEQY